ncbi:MAG: S41 family peptidase [Spirochaetaceae bacterium]|nr:S41 family peptidase [Spirochaetaceae bacterium]
MKIFRREIKAPVFAWGTVAILVLVLSLFSISAPTAAAQAAGTQENDAQRYSQLLQSIYQFIIQNYVDEVDPAKLYEGAMKGMFDALGDPHSVFLDEAMMSDMMRETDGTYAGIGLYISKESGIPKEGEEKYVEVISPIEDTPAWKAGILPGDLIISVDGDTTADMTADQASSRIRGETGTTVKIRFRRGGSYEFDVEFTRATIEIPPIKTGLIEKDGSKIGYIRIIEWIPQTADKVKAALEQLKSDGMTHLIVDVRSNPGGLLDSVVDVCDLFLDSGTIVSTKGRNETENYEYKAKPTLTIPKNIPMMVLVNQGSASASEIFAGAMKDTHRALLIGEKTYGKGSVQQVFPLDKTGFKLTMARYYTPSGVNIDKTGIEPDIVSPDLVLTDKQLESLEKLYDEGFIQSFASQHPQATVAERKAYARELTGKGYDLPEIYIEKLLRDEIDRTKPALVYDLEYDTQLNEALSVILSEDFDTRLQNSKTIEQTMLSH